MPCAEHLVEESAPGPAVATHHCPTDDPSAQSRSVDVPAAQLMAVATAIVPNWTSPALQAAPLLADHQPSETQPLYTRLQRLRL